MQLYNLVGNYNQVWSMLEDEEMDIQTIEDTLQSIEAGIEVKAQNTIMLVKNLEVYSNGIECEIKRLQAKQKAVTNKCESIKNYLFGQLELTGLSEIKTPVATIKQQNNPPAVQIEDESLVPAKFVTVIPETYKVSKTEIAKAIKAGEEVPGCKLTQSKTWRIK